MKRWILMFLLTFLIPIVSVDAYYCKYNEISRYKKLASNISTFYEYVESNDGITFSITLVNLNEDLYIVDATKGTKYYYTTDEITISGYSAGQTIKYNVYATNSNCDDELLYTIRVVLPQYNPYYDDKVCDGLETYILCQRWHGHGLDYDTFIKRIYDYKLSLVKPPISEEPVDSNYGLLSIIISLFFEYYHVILIPIIIICSVAIYIINKKSDIYR